MCTSMADHVAMQPGERGWPGRAPCDRRGEDGREVSATPPQIRTTAPSVGRVSRAPASREIRTVTAAWLLAMGATSETEPRASAR